MGNLAQELMLTRRGRSKTNFPSTRKIIVATIRSSAGSPCATYPLVLETRPQRLLTLLCLRDKPRQSPHSSWHFYDTSETYTATKMQLDARLSGKDEEMIEHVIGCIDQQRVLEESHNEY